MPPKAKAERISVTLTELAGLFAVSKATVKAWCDEGMPSNGGGRQGKARTIFLDEALPWYVRKMNRANDGLSELEKKHRVDRLIKEVELAQRLGNVIDSDAVNKSFAAAIVGLNVDLQKYKDERCRDFAASSCAIHIRETIGSDMQKLRERFANRLGELADYCEQLASDADAINAAAEESA